MGGWPGGRWRRGERDSPADTKNNWSEADTENNLSPGGIIILQKMTYWGYFTPVVYWNALCLLDRRS